MERGLTRRLAWVCAIVLALLALCPGEVHAQQPGEPLEENFLEDGAADASRADDAGLRRPALRPWRGGESGSQRASFGRRYLKTLGWLALVIVLAVGSIFLLRRFVPGASHPQNRRLVQVIGRGALGPKHQVVVTRVGERILILGLTSDSIVRLGEVEDPREAIRVLPPEASFEGQISLSEAAYREEDVARGEVDESHLEPYRREIDRLKGMVEVWKRGEGHPPQEEKRSRGSA